MPNSQVNSRLPEPDLAQKTLRKVSVRLLPLLAVCYGINYIDRVNIGFAALQMNKDLHFTASVYGFGAGVFFLSYAACEVPSNLLLVRFGARRWIARIMVTWGLLAAGMALVTTPWQFYVVRFLLGMAEAGFAPGAFYYLTLWFPQKEQARAISRFYVAVPVSATLMASVSGPLLSLQGRLGLKGWQWLFLLEALPAIALGIFVLFVLPDGPADARWLSLEERSWVASRLQRESNAKSSGCHSTMRGAVRDIRIWMFAFFLLPTFAATYAYSLTAPLLIRELTGYGNSAVGLIVAAIYIAIASAILVNGAVASSGKSPYLCIAVPTLLIVLGCLGVGLLKTPALVICSLALIPICNNANLAPLFAIVGSFLKKQGAAGGLALVTTIGIVGGFLGPYYIGLAKDLTGSYQKGFLGLSVACFLSLLLILHLARSARANKLQKSVPSVAVAPESEIL